MNTEELLGRYAAGERDFSGVKVDSARLRDAELPGINLSGAILFGAKLDRANLTCANLSHANLGSAWLEEANLTGANLSHAVISDGVLSEADLSGANLSYADLTACALDGANLSDFQKINYPIYSDNILLSSPCSLLPAPLPTQRWDIFLVGSPLVGLI